MRGAFMRRLFIIHFPFRCFPLFPAVRFFCCAVGAVVLALGKLAGFGGACVVDDGMHRVEMYESVLPQFAFYRLIELLLLGRSESFKEFRCLGAPPVA